MQQECDRGLAGRAHRHDGKVSSSKSKCGIADRVTVARWGRSLYSRQGIGAISVTLPRVIDSCFLIGFRIFEVNGRRI
jgi:hypothetical protein